MEETITLKSIETKTTKAGAPMWTATTSTGKMSCFNKQVADQLFTLVNRNIIVEVEMQGQYKNLMKIVGMAEFAPIPTSQQQAQVQFENPKMKARLSSGTMCIAYAKDLCVAGKIEVKDIPSKAKEFLSLYEEMLDAKFV